MKECRRCGEHIEILSSVGATLYHFVCDNCRLDPNLWDFKGDITVEAMEYQSPEVTKK